MRPNWRTPFVQIIRKAQGDYPTSEHQARRFWLQAHGKIPQDEATTPDPIDWHVFYQRLAEVYGYSPQEINQMTLPEIYAMLSPPQTPPMGEIIQQAKAYKLLTLEEKLEMARFLQEVC